MKNSSARQREFDFAGADTLIGGGNVSATTTARTEQSSAPTPIRFPSLGLSPETYAITARQAGRVNAASVSDDELNALLRERQTLLDKKFAGTMSRKEANRLEYVRWSLDRIEDARHGETLDVLEGLIARYEQFQSDLQLLQRDLSQHMRGARK